MTGLLTVSNGISLAWRKARTSFSSWPARQVQMMILWPARWKACKASLAPGLSEPIFGYLWSTTVPSKSTAMIKCVPRCVPDFPGTLENSSLQLQNPGIEGVLEFHHRSGPLLDVPVHASQEGLSKDFALAEGDFRNLGLHLG